MRYVTVGCVFDGQASLCGHGKQEEAMHMIIVSRAFDFRIAGGTAINLKEPLLIVSSWQGIIALAKISVSPLYRRATASGSELSPFAFMPEGGTERR